MFPTQNPKLLIVFLGEKDVVPVKSGLSSGLKKRQVPELKKVSNIKEVLPDNSWGSDMLFCKMEGA